MAMIRKSFELAMQKGRIGEVYVKNWLERKGYIVYMPATNGAHAFDMMAIKDKAKCVALDIKCKARMNKFNATGINQNHFETYKAFQDKHNMPFWLVFVDEAEKLVYGNAIHTLEKGHRAKDGQYPMLISGGKIRLWSLEQMIYICNLDDAVAAELAGLSQRNYAYTNSNSISQLSLGVR